MHPNNPKYPHPSSAAVSAVMKSNRRADTKPEVAIRSELHKLGLRFRKDFIINIDGRRCRPDIVFTKSRLAVFIDGCFWHLCPQHGHMPRANVSYWHTKLYGNKARDEADTLLLSNNGWHVLRLWEHVPSVASVILILFTLEALGKNP